MISRKTLLVLIALLWCGCTSNQVGSVVEKQEPLVAVAVGDAWGHRYSEVTWHDGTEYRCIGARGEAIWCERQEK